MIRHEYISVQDYRRVGLANEYWLWHFTASKPLPTQQIQSLMGPTDEIGFHPFRYIVDQMSIPVFESESSKSYDFLLSLDPHITANKLYQRDHFFTLVLGFNYMRLVTSTFHPNKCYCAEGIISVVADLNANLLKDFKFD
jgi:hypothetical protein